MHYVQIVNFFQNGKLYGSNIKFLEEQLESCYNAIEQDKPKNFLAYCNVIDQVLGLVINTQEPAFKKILTDFENYFRQYISTTAPNKELWDKYYTFCKNWKIKGLPIEDLMALCGRTYEVFMLAFELERKNNDVSKARSILLDGVKAYPHDLTMQLAFVDFEIDIAESPPRGVTLEDACLTSIAVQINQYVKKSGDLKGLKYICNRLRKFGPSKLKLAVLKQIKDLDKYSEYGWDACARCSFERAVLEKKTKCIKNELEIARQTYLSGLERHQTLDMYTLHIQFLEDLEKLKIARPSKWDEYFLSSTVSLDHLKLYAKLPGTLNYRVLEAATQRYPQILLFHVRFIETLLNFEDFHATQTAFSQIKQRTFEDDPENAKALFSLLIKKLPSSLQPALSEILQWVTSFNGDTGKDARLMYLSWTAKNYGIEKVRSIASEPIVVQNPDLNFYKKWLELEKAEPEPSIEAIRIIIQRMLIWSPEERETWREWIKIENTLGNPGFVFNIIDEAYRRAPPIVSHFLYTQEEFVSKSYEDLENLE